MLCLPTLITISSPLSQDRWCRLMELTFHLRLCLKLTAPHLWDREYCPKIKWVRVIVMNWIKKWVHTQEKYLHISCRTAFLPKFSVLCSGLHPQIFPSLDSSKLLITTFTIGSKIFVIKIISGNQTLSHPFPLLHCFWRSVCIKEVCNFTPHFTHRCLPVYSLEYAKGKASVLTHKISEHHALLPAHFLRPLPGSKIVFIAIIATWAENRFEFDDKGMTHIMDDI